MKINEIIEVPECPENCNTGKEESCWIKQENGNVSRCSIFSRKISTKKFHEILKVSDIEILKPFLRSQIRNVFNQQAQIQEIYSYLEGEGRQILLISPYGTGKSMLLYVILFELICHCQKVFYVKADILKKAIRNEIMDQPPSWLENFRNSKFLLIDDFALEPLSAQATYFEELLSTLMESSGKKIIWATNWRIEDIREKYKVHGPLQDRLKLLKVIKWTGNSMRNAK